jgi:cytochrome c-type biogenesis protein CcmF
VRFESLTRAQGPNFTADRATLSVLDGQGNVRFVMAPEKRFFPSQRMSTTEAAIRTNGMADLYAVLGDVVVQDGAEGGAAVIRLHHNPLAPWIWGGAVIMALGGGVSLADRRHRVGAPSRRRIAATA